MVPFTYYTELSLWDTFRAENPLLALTQPARVNDIVKTMLAHYQFYGKNVLPIWANAGKETYCMIGNHAIPIIAEAYAKGFRDWDASAALEAMQASVNSTRDFQDKYRQLGYVPGTPQHGSAGAAQPQSPEPRARWNTPTTTPASRFCPDARQERHCLHPSARGELARSVGRFNRLRAR